MTESPKINRNWQTAASGYQPVQRSFEIVKCVFHFSNFTSDFVWWCDQLHYIMTRETGNDLWRLGLENDDSRLDSDSKLMTRDSTRDSTPDWLDSTRDSPLGKSGDSRLDSRLGTCDSGLDSRLESHDSCTALVRGGGWYFQRMSVLFGGRSEQALAKYCEEKTANHEYWINFYWFADTDNMPYL